MELTEKEVDALTSEKNGLIQTIHEEDQKIPTDDQKIVLFSDKAAEKELSLYRHYKEQGESEDAIIHLTSAVSLHLTQLRAYANQTGNMNAAMMAAKALGELSPVERRTFL